MMRTWYTVEAVASKRKAFPKKGAYEPLEERDAHYVYECVSESASAAIEDFYQSVMVSKNDLISIRAISREEFSR